MNGVHDMGGMHGMGRVAPNAHEPLFHEPWEARALALTIAAGASGQWNIDQSRHQRELIPGPDYLRISYYERWITALTALLVSHHLISEGEARTGVVDLGSAVAIPSLAADRVNAVLARGAPTSRTVVTQPRFGLGQGVRARDLNPEGHTRLPRYVRGRPGCITRLHGAHVLPDTNAHGEGENPEALYQVRFEAQDLWGQGDGRPGAIYLDLWESYLDPA